jgi:hypothetical protein
MACGPSRRLERSDTWPQQLACIAPKNPLPAESRSTQGGFQSFVETCAAGAVAPTPVIDVGGDPTAWSIQSGR